MGHTLYGLASDALLIVSQPDEVLCRLADAMVQAGLGRTLIVDPGARGWSVGWRGRNLLSLRAH